MSERMTVSFEERIASRVRQCGARRRGGASGYLAELVRRDELREAAEALARWESLREVTAEQEVTDAAAALEGNE